MIESQKRWSWLNDSSLICMLGVHLVTLWCSLSITDSTLSCKLLVMLLPAQWRAQILFTGSVSCGISFSAWQSLVSSFDSLPPHTSFRTEASRLRGLKTREHGWRKHGLAVATSWFPLPTRKLKVHTIRVFFGFFFWRAHGVKEFRLKFKSVPF